MPPRLISLQNHGLRAIIPRQVSRLPRFLFLLPTSSSTSLPSCHYPSSSKSNFTVASALNPFVSASLSNPFQHQARTMSSATTFYDFEPVDKKGATFHLNSLQGKVVLVVNTASKCGFTPQFEGLEKLYQTLKARYPDQFTILGFPCNQFGSQDPGSNDDIQSFCQLNYGVTFPVLGKLDVNGSEAAPVFTWLKEQQPGVMGYKPVKWNFEKFLVSADGKVVGRWSSLTKPESLQDPIEKEIAKAKAAGTLSSAEEGKSS